MSFTSTSYRMIRCRIGSKHVRNQHKATRKKGKKAYCHKTNLTLHEYVFLAASKVETVVKEHFSSFPKWALVSDSFSCIPQLFSMKVSTNKQKALYGLRPQTSSQQEFLSTVQLFVSLCITAPGRQQKRLNKEIPEPKLFKKLCRYFRASEFSKNVTFALN